MKPHEQPGSLSLGLDVVVLLDGSKRRFRMEGRKDI